MLHSSRVGTVASGLPVEWISGFKGTQKMGDLLEVQFHGLAREEGRAHS